MRPLPGQWRQIDNDHAKRIPTFNEIFDQAQTPILLFYQISRIVKSSLVKRPAEEEDVSRNRKGQSECDCALHF